MKRTNFLIAAIVVSFYLPSLAATYYVDASRPNDAGDGRSWGAAKQTIQAAVDLAVAGDTVLVTNGVYNVGTRATPNYALKNRIVITNAVAVRSVNGAEVTVIEGSGASTYATVNAIRCVYLMNGSLDGFTIRNGATYQHITYENGFEKGGAGVDMQGCANNTEVRNCIIHSCCAYDGGGARFGRLVNCVLYGNWAYYGGAAYRSDLKNCTLSGNTGAADCGGAYVCSMTNSIAYGNGKNYHGGSIDHSCTTPLPTTGTHNIATDPLFVDSANHNFRLQDGSPCINAGSNEGVAGMLDLAGWPRILNGRVDIGAYESGVSITATAGEGGSITPAGAVPVVYGGGACFTIQPAPNHHVADVLVNGLSVGPVSSYAFSAVTNNQTICASFAIDEYALTVVSEQGGLAQGTFPIGYGSSISLWVTNSPLVCGTTQYVCTGAAVIGNDFSLSCPTNVTLTLTNTAKVVWQWSTNYLLAAAADGSGTVRGGGWYAAGSEVTLVATPDEHHQFTGWSDGAQTGARLVVVPVGGASFTAEFEPIPRGFLRLQKSFYSVAENAVAIQLKVERYDGSYGPASVSFAVAPGSASADEDYSATPSTFSWTNGQAGAKSIVILMLDDAAFEGNETFTVRLIEATGASLGEQAEALVTIVDNEGVPASVPRFSGSLDYGDVATNAVAMRTVAVWNDGNQALSVTNVLLPSGFSVTQQVFTVPAGEAVQLPVWFAPAELAAYDGLLTLGCNATSGMVSLAVSGTGVAPVPPVGVRTITGLTAVIVVDVSESAVVLGVEDSLSQGLIPVEISDGGSWDSANRKVKWFFNTPGQVRDRALQYRVSASGCVETGVVNFGSEDIAVTGDTIFTSGNGPGLLHPADDNGDWRVVLNEVSASVSRWKSGLDDQKTPVVIRGITLYLQGEEYVFDARVSAEAKRWIPLITTSSSLGCSSSKTISMSAAPVGAERSVQATNVTVSVTPALSTSAWGMEEHIPDGVTVSGISNNGTWDANNRKIKWAFFDGGARTLSYNVIGPAGTCVTVAGSVSFDGSADTVSGSSVIAVPMSFQTWAERRGLTGTTETLFNATNPDYGMPNGFVYAFGPNLKVDDPVLTLSWVDGKPVIETPSQDPTTIGFVDVFPVGTEDLAAGDWSLVLAPASDSSDTPTNRCKWNPIVVPSRAFFKVRAIMR